MVQGTGFRLAVQGKQPIGPSLRVTHRLCRLWKSVGAVPRDRRQPLVTNVTKNPQTKERESDIRTLWRSDSGTTFCCLSNCIF